MLAAENRHKDVVLILTQKGGANLDLVNKVSVHTHMSYNMTLYTSVFISILKVDDNIRKKCHLFL